MLGGGSGFKPCWLDQFCGNLIPFCVIANLNMHFETCDVQVTSEHRRVSLVDEHTI